LSVRKKLNIDSYYSIIVEFEGEENTRPYSDKLFLSVGISFSEKLLTRLPSQSRKDAQLVADEIASAIKKINRDIQLVRKKYPITIFEND